MKPEHPVLLCDFFYRSVKGHGWDKGGTKLITGALLEYELSSDNQRYLEIFVGDVVCTIK